MSKFCPITRETCREDCEMLDEYGCGLSTGGVISHDEVNYTLNAIKDSLDSIKQAIDAIC